MMDVGSVRPVGHSSPELAFQLAFQSPELAY